MEESIYEKNEWVDVGAGNASAPSPAPRRRQAMRVLVFALLVLIGILLIVAFIWSLFIGPQAGEEQNAMDEEIRLAIAECNREQNPEGCLENLAAELAQQNGDGSYCEMVETTDLNECYFLAALSSNDRTVCSDITEKSSRESCEDSLLKDPETYEDCSSYHDTERTEECQEIWVRDQWRAGDCSSELVANELCNGQVILAAAQEAKDPDLCNQITQETVQSACFELVGYGDRDFDGVDAAEEEFQGTSDFDEDTDNDGLSDFDEIYTYGTSPVLLDTDGDGYDDKLEVEKGFNPLQ